MTIPLRHHGLIVVDCNRGDTLICWLRVYELNNVLVSIVTDVPGNPGQSTSNAIEELARWITKQFPRGKLLRIYSVLPRGAAGDDEPQWAEAIGALDHRPNWRFGSQNEVEALVGSHLPPLPEHDDLYRQVLEAGGGIYQELYRKVFEPVPVAGLPAPHLPSRCLHYQRFKDMADEDEDEDEGGEETRLGQRFLASLTPVDLEQCPYHRADWRAIAEESCRILAAVGPAEPGDYVRAARSSTLPLTERRWLESLFFDPVSVGEGGYGNGQHRGCALRFSGAPAAAVRVGHEHLGRKLLLDWHYLGGG